MNLSHLVKGPAHKGVKIASSALAVSTLCVYVAVFHNPLRDTSFRQMPFDSIAWQTGDAWGRGQMVESLQKQALLHNRSKDEVLALLGKGNEDYDYQLRYRVDIGRRIESRPVYVTFIVSFDGEMKAYKSGVFD